MPALLLLGEGCHFAHYGSVAMFDLYPTLRPFLFALPAERAHSFGLASLRAAHRLHLLPDPNCEATESVSAMG
ncbi:MAG TPA: hypothetical protein VIT67_13685, partial [Povalibacter sp.]